MDGFLVAYCAEVAAYLTGWCLTVGAPKLFLAGFRKVQDQAQYYPPEARQTVIFNLGNYVHAVNSEVQQRVNDGSFDAERAESLLSTPTVQRLLSSAAEFASENDDDLAMKSLASLVASALQADAGSRLSQIVQMSERALKVLRPANLRQLALIYALKEYRPTDEMNQIADRGEQLDRIETDLFSTFEALSDVTIPFLDALVLQEAGTVEFRARTSGYTNARFESGNLQRSALVYTPGGVGERPALQWFLSGFHRTQPGTAPDNYGQSHFALTASGIALGYATLMKATQQQVKLDEVFGKD